MAGFYVHRCPEYTRSINTVSDTYTSGRMKNVPNSFTLSTLTLVQSTWIVPFNALLTDLQENDGNNLKIHLNQSFVGRSDFGVTWNPVTNYGNIERNFTYSDYRLSRVRHVIQLLRNPVIS
ncbi:MAG: hypothetical protein IPJ20_17440 [Flammeovirgaceae bacterium]|nr:hypothetical protein [Flammeovirgaceae bacterium]